MSSASASMTNRWPEGTYSHADHIARFNRCAVCSGALGIFRTARREGSYPFFVADCYADPGHEGYRAWTATDDAKERLRDLEQRQHQRHAGKSNLDPELRDIARKGLLEE